MSNKLFKNIWKIIKKDPFTGEREKTQVLLICMMQCICMAFIILLAVLNFINNNMITFYVCAISWIINLPLTIYTIRTKKKKPAIPIYTIAFILIYTYAIYAGANDAASVLWIYMLPIMNLFILGFKPAFIVSGWFILLLSVLAISPTLRSFLQYPYPDGRFIRYLFIYIADFICSFFIFYENCESIQFQDDYAIRLRDALIEERVNVNNISMQTILAINQAVESKDKYTGEHSKRVAYISKKIAETMRFSVVEQNRIYNIALLHDIGKIGIDEKLLLKNGKLSEEEFNKLKEHAVIGGEILQTMDFIPNISNAIRHHHENWDGSGYPDGLKGFDIPIESRIIAIADTFDAMLHDRSYRGKSTFEEVKVELQEKSRNKYDPQLVTIVLKLCETDNLIEDIDETEFEELGEVIDE